MRRKLLIDWGIYLIELNDVVVTDLLENLDLARDALHVLLVVDFLLLEDFDSDLAK